MKLKGFVLGLCVAAVLVGCATDSREREALSSLDVQNLVAGNTLSGATIKRAQFAIYFRQDGTATGELSEVRTDGDWEVTGNGELCTRFPGWDQSDWAGGNRLCYAFYRSGNNYALYEGSKLAGTVISVSEGNPRGF